MHVIEISLTAQEGGLSSKIALSNLSVQYTVPPKCNSLMVTLDVDCFIRMGTNPTALADGTDQFLLGGNTFRITVSPGTKVAFISNGGSGYGYITPE